MPKKLAPDFLYKDLTYELIGCFYTVHNQLGFGHKEKVYQRALKKELSKKDVLFKREAQLDVLYDGEVVAKYQPDFVIENKVIVEVKAVNFLPAAHEKQLLYYLKGTGCKLGFIVNFGKEKVEIRRRIWTTKYEAKTNQR